MKINHHNCVDCALKHLAGAAILGREILNGYDNADYRLYWLGNLKEAEEQLIVFDPVSAREIRALRKAVQPHGLATVLTETRLNRLRDIALSIDEKLKLGLYEGEGCDCGVKGPVDVIIPLRYGGSASGNDELRFALRSIQKHLKNYRNIYVISSREPIGFQNIRYVHSPDSFPRKQMNIHRAILAALRTPGIADEVLFWADDNLLLDDQDALHFPTVARTDDMLNFSNAPDARVWHRSVRNTADLLLAKGFKTTNFESHTPVRFNRANYLALEDEFDFYDDVGLCYISLYCNYYRIKIDAFMADVKATFESDRVEPEKLTGKRFAGYCDTGVDAGVLKIFREHFPERSKYEVPPRTLPLCPQTPRICAILGTFGWSEAVELNLHYLAEVNQLPLVVIDDASDDSRLRKAVAAHPGVELIELPRRYGHFAGDLQIFAEGLNWAKRNQFDYAIKVSRRFVAMKPWISDFIRLAQNSDGITFSSYTTSYNYGFRTECLGMYVPAWHEAVERILEPALPEARLCVERWMHQIGRDLLAQWRTEKNEAYSAQHPQRHDRQGYVFWELLGTDRREHREGFLWHDIDAPEMYRAALQKINNQN